MAKKVRVDRRKCAYCGACVAICNFNANELIELYLEIYKDKCTGCSLCVKVCPVGALSVVEV